MVMVVVVVKVVSVVREVVIFWKNAQGMICSRDVVPARPKIEAWGRLTL